MVNLRSARKNSGAFSLLEIVVALAVAMLLLGVATLAIGSVNEEHRIRKFAGQIETASRAVLLDAVSQRQDRVLVIDKNRLANPLSEKSFTFPKIEIAIGEEWKTPRDFRWRFYASGICEPIQLRLKTDAAEMEMTFDPLTGEIADETLTVTK